MAPLFRRLVAAAAAANLAGGFDVTLEATHHGPWVDTPCLFAEIGSSEGEWQRSDAAALWADVLADELRLTCGGGGEWWDLLRERSTPLDSRRAGPLRGSSGREGASAETRSGSAPLRSGAGRREAPPHGSGEARAVVAVGLGGGHYAPRHGDLIRRHAGAGPGGGGAAHGGVFLGHVAASYALDFGGDGWQSAVRECVESTRRAFPVSHTGTEAPCRHLDAQIEELGAFQVE